MSLCLIKGTAEALIYVAKCEPSLVDSWRNDRTFPLVHLALLNNNLEVLDCLVHDFGLSASLTDRYIYQFSLFLNF